MGYAIQSGNDKLILSMNELKTYFAINIAMTYTKYTNICMYWSSLPVMRMSMIADAMSVNRFATIKSYLHFEDIANKPHDKYWKYLLLICFTTHFIQLLGPKNIFA